MNEIPKEQIIKEIKVHHSLLPAFQTDDPVRDAILSGVKVTGVTLVYKERIVAQYPIFITNDMHYDELKLFLQNIENIIVPLVAEKLSKNEAFEIQTLMSQQKCHGCSNCGDCCS